MNGEKGDLKKEFLKQLEAHKEQLGDDYKLIKEKVINMKADFLSKEEVVQITEWIKKHPFLTVAFAMLFGAAVHKLFGKR